MLMKAESTHLARIMEKQNRITSLQIVFADIEKYSKRRTVTQTEVIDRFTQCLRAALTATAQQYIAYAQSNGVNFLTDIITIPTGDGVAVAFSFEGLHDIHFFFAKQFLKEVYDSNVATPCEKYGEHGWCNCHPNLGIRIGISDGRGIIYRDINDNYNVAGGVINLAARVMGQADKGQIMFTKEAYQQLIDMIDDPNLIDRFTEYKKVRLKHELEVDLYQYKGAGEVYIDSSPPKDLALSQRGDEAMAKIQKQFGIPNSADIKIGAEQVINFFEALADMVGPGGEGNEKVIDIKSKINGEK
jgi:class 3 adenylate cyclase